jgi:hypothetical protein
MTTSRLPKKSLILCGCALYLAYALVWGLRQHEQSVADAALLATCRDTSASVRGTALAEHGQRPATQPPPATPHTSMSQQASWAKTRAP